MASAAVSDLTSVDCDGVFEALTNVYRRRLLVLLAEHDPGTDGVRIPDDVHNGRKAKAILQAEMFHKHVPKLEELGLVEWDQTTDSVVPGPAFPEIRPVIELLAANPDALPCNWLD